MLPRTPSRLYAPRSNFALLPVPRSAEASSASMNACFFFFLPAVPPPSAGVHHSQSRFAVAASHYHQNPDLSLCVSVAWRSAASLPLQCVSLGWWRRFVWAMHGAIPQILCHGSLSARRISRPTGRSPVQSSANANGRCGSTCGSRLMSAYCVRVPTIILLGVIAAAWETDRLHCQRATGDDRADAAQARRVSVRDVAHEASEVSQSRPALSPHGRRTHDDMTRFR